MHIVRSDENGDTKVVTLVEMRAELETLAVWYDPEVNAVENATILLFNFVGDAHTDEITILVNDGINFTIRENPVPINQSNKEA